jgi:hypothetical protein
MYIYMHYYMHVTQPHAYAHICNMYSLDQRTRTTWYSLLLALLVQKYKYWHLKSAETQACFTSTKLQILG